MGKRLRTDILPKKEKIKLFGGDELPEMMGPIIRICGNREAAVDGCKGVADYYENMIRLRLQGGSVTIEGKALSVVTLTGSSALIRGTIDNVSFSMRADSV